MIACFQGTPGAGKSLETSKRIVNYLKIGRKVYSNLDGQGYSTHIEAIKVLSGLDDVEMSKQFVFMDSDMSKRVWEFVEDQSVVVIDEAHNHYNARDWQTDKNRKFAEWCSVHRHRGIDIILITHDIDRIDIAIRCLIEWTYRYRKMNFFGRLFSNKYLEYVYPQDDVKGNALSRKTKKLDSRYYHTYESYTAADIKEHKLLKGANVLRHPIFFMIPLVIGISLYLLFNSSIFSGKVFGVDLKKSKTGVVQPLKQEKNAPTVNSMGGFYKDGVFVPIKQEKDAVEVKQAFPEINKSLPAGSPERSEKIWNYSVKKQPDGSMEFYDSSGEYKGFIKIHKGFTPVAKEYDPIEKRIFISEQTQVEKK